MVKRDADSPRVRLRLLTGIPQASIPPPTDEQLVLAKLKSALEEIIQRIRSRRGVGHGSEDLDDLSVLSSNPPDT